MKFYLILCSLLAAGLSFASNDNTSEKQNKEDAKSHSSVVIKDYGAEPTVLDIEAYTSENKNFRSALWTGKHLQVTLMSIPVGGEVGLEKHPDIDQFLRIEEGSGMVMMGDSKDALTFNETAKEDYAIFVPAGKWHNIVNTGNKPLKLYSIYSPAEHPHGTVHKTYEEAMAAEHEH